YLKIDGRIIQKFQQDRASHAMVKAIASFALALDIPLVAEHVTREEEVKELKRLNFRYLQGYFIGEPMPFEELAGLFDSNSSRLTEALPLA
ncbi:MAG: EAL domain-containing protein, partial [Aeromonadaceae bacterium]|nr:EAL domain-containing protein [Aeromonadaceae bacterium]